MSDNYKNIIIEKLKQKNNLLLEEYEQLEKKSNESNHYFKKCKNKKTKDLIIEYEKIETINYDLKNEIRHLNHLRRLDLEYLGILIWGYGIKKDKYDSMDERIYAGDDTYCGFDYNWDMLQTHVSGEKLIDSLFDRIVSIKEKGEKSGTYNL